MSEVTRLFIGGLPNDGVDEDQLMQQFEQFQPTTVELKNGFAFMNFDNPEDCSKA